VCGKLDEQIGTAPVPHEEIDDQEEARRGQQEQ
jgi:hypothetical protein